MSASLVGEPPLLCESLEPEPQWKWPELLRKSLRVETHVSPLLCESLEPEPQWKWLELLCTSLRVTAPHVPQSQVQSKL